MSQRLYNSHILMLHLSNCDKRSTIQPGRFSYSSNLWYK